MFTGIVTNIGRVEEINLNQKQDLLLKISVTEKINRKLEIGCSIACNGICLTLISKKTSGKKNVFSFQASKETCVKTTLANWRIGELINLEFSLRLGDELGGHLVSGHIDGVVKITKIIAVKDSKKFIFAAKKDLLKFIAPKGSVALNGVSLTVNEVTKNSFSVNLIPHTIAHTAFKNSKIGDTINLEIDTLARYAAKILKK